MRGLRRSLSAHKRLESSEDEGPGIPMQPIVLDPPRRTSSLDTFTIPGRTRYPSDRDRSPRAEPVDLKVARSLLGFSADSNPTDCHCRPGLPRVPRSMPAMQGLDVNMEREHRGHSRNISTQSSSTGLLSTLSSNDGRPTAVFMDQYNLLAKQLQLTELPDLEEECASEPERLGSKKPAKRSMWRKLVHSSSSKDDTSNAPPRPLTRKGSIGSLIHKRSKLALNCTSLEQVYRFGGINVVNLPPSHRACHLPVPTCIAATANYLVEHGPRTPGIFRIPGQASVVNSLYDYYVHQVRAAEKDKHAVEAAVGSSCLPKEVDCGVHDVASAFKKFLWDVPGGILGSLPLFTALWEIQSLQERHSATDKSLTQSRLIALAILSLRSARRIALLSAVFGLLSLLKDDSSLDPVTASIIPGHRQGSEAMSSKALAVVFAPVLLGGLTERIPLYPDKSAATQHQVTPKRSAAGLISHFKHPKVSKTSISDRTPEMSATIERNDMATAVIVLLLRQWTHIVFQMRVLERQATSSDHVSLSLPCARPQITSHHPDARNSGRLTPYPSRQHGAAVTFAGLPERAKAQSTGRDHNRSSSASKVFSFLRHRSSSVDVAAPDAPIPQPAIRKNSSMASLALPSPVSSRDSSAWWVSLSGRNKETFQNVPKLDSPSLVRVDEVEAAASASSKIPDQTGSVLHLPKLGFRTLSSDNGSPAARVRTGSSSEGLQTDGRLFSASEHRREELANLASRSPPPVSLRHASYESVKEPRVWSAAGPSHENIVSRASGLRSGLQSIPNPFSSAFDSNATSAMNSTCASTSSHPSRKDDVLASAPLLQAALGKPLPPLPSSMQMSAAEESPRIAVIKPSPSKIPKLVTDSVRTHRVSPSHSTLPQSAPNSSTLRSPANSGYASSKKFSLPRSIKQRLSPADIPLPPSGSVQLALDGTDSKRAQRNTSQPRLSRGLGPEEPPISRRILFRPEDNPQWAATVVGPFDQEDDLLVRTGSQKANVGTLFAEIRRLKLILDSRNETILQMQQQLDATRLARDSATLSEKLRETERDLHVWKHRAEWAETRLYRHSGSFRLSSANDVRLRTVLVD